MCIVHQDKCLPNVFILCVFVILPEENNMHYDLLGLIRLLSKISGYSLEAITLMQIYILNQATFKTC